MAINPLKAFLFAGGGVVAVAGTAYVTGALDPLFQSVPPAQIAALEPAGSATTPGTESRLPAKGTDAAATPAPEAQPSTPAPAASNPPATAPAPAAQEVVPSFDVVRVEGNGSVVIAGNAAPKSKVEALNNGTVLGSADAGPDGAFAIVLDTPLKPGDYQITLRSITPDNVTATSPQTAVVSIPQKPDGQVLAMVEEPGKPSELLSVPAPEKQPEAAAKPAEPETRPVGSEAKPAEPATAAAPAESKPTEAASAQAEATPAPAQPASPVAPATGAKVVVEAVEIDGGKIFVAGIADAGRKVRAYANEILLGDATTSPDGHFLVEANRDLPVGTYNVRVDALDGDGAKVVARATVPFEREPGESIAAVAPTEPAKPTVEQPAGTATAQSETSPSGENKPAEVAAANPPAANSPAANSPADGVPETVAPKLEHADSAVIIRRRDTLWRISRRVYGHGIRYSTIYLANQDQISDPDKIWPGQVFKLPEKSREGELADMKVLGDQMTTAPAKTE